MKMAAPRKKKMLTVAPQTTTEAFANTAINRVKELIMYTHILSNELRYSLISYLQSAVVSVFDIT